MSSETCSGLGYLQLSPVVPLSSFPLHTYTYPQSNLGTVRNLREFQNHPESLFQCTADGESPYHHSLQLSTSAKCAAHSPPPMSQSSPTTDLSHWYIFPPVRTTLGGAQGLFLVLYNGIIPGGTQGMWYQGSNLAWQAYSCCTICTAQICLIGGGSEVGSCVAKDLPTNIIAGTSVDVDSKIRSWVS